MKNNYTGKSFNISDHDLRFAHISGYRFPKNHPDKTKAEINNEINRIEANILNELYYTLDRKEDVEQKIFKVFTLGGVLNESNKKLYLYRDKEGRLLINPITALEIYILKGNYFIVNCWIQNSANLVYKPLTEEVNIRRKKDHSPLKVAIITTLRDEIKGNITKLKRMKVMDVVLNSLVKSNDINSLEFISLLKIYFKFFDDEKSAEYEVNERSFVVSQIQKICEQKIIKEYNKIGLNFFKKIFKRGSRFIKELIKKDSNDFIYKAIEAKHKAYATICHALNLDRYSDQRWVDPITSEIQLKIFGFLLGVDLDEPKEEIQEQKKYLIKVRSSIIEKKWEFIPSR